MATDIETLLGNRCQCGSNRYVEVEGQILCERCKHPFHPPMLDEHWQARNQAMPYVTGGQKPVRKKKSTTRWSVWPRGCARG